MLTLPSPKPGKSYASRSEDSGPTAGTNTRNGQDLSRATSYVTDEGDVLARELPRPNLLRRIKTPRGPNELRRSESESESEFTKEVLRGLYRRAPDKASYVLHDRREGTMTEIGEGRVLPMRAQDVRRRQEHLERGVRDMRELRRGGRSGLRIVREAFIQEFRDLYEMMNSIEGRRWDVCKGDVLGLFEWFKMVENFLRVYVIVSQESYTAAGQGDWGVREKKRVLARAERVGEMKRLMVAMDRRCGEMVARLRRRVEEFVEGVLGFLEDECRVVERFLEDGFDEMVKRMGEQESGKESVVLLGRGSRDSEWGKKMGGWRAVRRVKERHWEYVTMFAAADREYRTIYGSLADEVDRQAR